MADVFISPGVFTEEIDKTTLAAGVAGIGPAFIGAAEKGPAFLPMAVSTFSEFQQIFGKKDPDKLTYLAYAAEAYFKNQSTLNIVRILGDNDSNSTEDLKAGFIDVSNIKFIEITPTVGDPYIAAAFWTSGSADISVTGSIPSTAYGNFTLSLTDVAPSNFSASICLDPTKSNYIKNVFNTDYLQYLPKHYMLHDVFDYGINGSANISNISIIGSLSSGSFVYFNEPYTTPQTPWIYSQNFGDAAYKLFKIFALSDGEWANKNIKISILNIKKSVNEDVTKYGSFNIIVRQFDDTDKDPVILESFSALSLNPKSENYISKRIGNRHWIFNSVSRKSQSLGDYENISKYIRIEVSTDLLNNNVPENALPWGFGTFPKLHEEIPNFTLTSKQYINNAYTSKKYYGVLFEQKDSDLISNASSPKHDVSVGDPLYYIPSNISGSNSPDTLWFTLNNLSGLGSTGSIKLNSTQIKNLQYTAGYNLASVNAIAGTTAAKFSFSFHGGFDGLTPFFKSTFYTWQIVESDGSKILHSLIGGFDTAPSSESGSTPGGASGYIPWTSATNEDDNYLIYSLRKGVEIVSDPDMIDINILSIPGITCGNINQYSLTQAEARGDTLFITDLFESTTPVDEESGEFYEIGATQIRKNLGFDSSYAATYFPWFKTYDTTNKKTVWLPPSIAILSALALTDSIAFSWSAPAGLTRGGISEALEVAYRTNYLERNDLYDAGINPIAHFPREGIVIWGQKTLLVKQSYLDRVNVRRLLLYARKTIASAVKYLVFEPNNINTWERFVNLVNPVLEYIQLNQGLTRFRVICDSSTNTKDLIDRNVMKGVIIIMPTTAAEVIKIPFLVTAEGSLFSE